MRRTALLATLFVFLCLALGCGGPTSEKGAPVVGSGLPGPGPSWIAGTRAQPVGGRIVVGLLLAQRPQRRLADLIPAEKLQTFLDSEEIALEETEVNWAYLNPSYRTWGKQGGHLLGVARALREKHGVEVLFREVLADECAALPLIVVGGRKLHAHERLALKAYRQKGGRVVRLGRTLVPGKQPSHATLVEQVLVSVLADSPLVQVLPVDPLAAEARREGDDVVLTLPQIGTLVALEDATGRVLATARTGKDHTVRLHAPDPELDPFTHHIVVQWEGQAMALSRATSVADLVGTVDLRFTASEKVHAGGVLAVRVEAKRGDVAAADRRGRVALVRDEQVLVRADYVTDDSGLAHPRLAVPLDVTPGPAVLRCDGLTHSLEITSGLRLSVVTDRPLYKETDHVRVRVMAHRAGDGRPVGGQQVELSLGEAKRQVTTSEHGIASHTFELVGARVGTAHVQAAGGGAKVRCAFRVKAFERPTFTVRADPPELNLRQGEAASVMLYAAYVNGSPFVGGRLWLDARKLKLEEEPRGFDAQGGARVVVRAPAKLVSADLRVSVQDAEGRRVDCHVPVRVQRDGPVLGAWPLSDLAVGVPARFLIRGPAGGSVRLGGAFDGPRSVDLGADERAIVTLTPQRAQFLLRVIPSKGTSYEHTFKARRPKAGGLVMALDRRTGRVGETLRIALRGTPGLVYVDVWKDQTAVRLLSARLEEGGADLDLELEASLAGVLHVFARRADSSVKSATDAARATVLVTRGRALQVTAAARQESYVPGATAEVDVTVRTRAGEPTAAVLGYWGVDDALLALAASADGHETVFDVVTSHAGGPERALAARVDGGARVTAWEVLSLFHDGGQRTPTRRKFAVDLERTPRLVRAALRNRVQRVTEGVRLIWDAYGAAWKDIPVTELVTSDSVCETLQWLVRQGRLDAALLLDPWHTPYALWSDRRNVVIGWESAGPDRVFGTADDVIGSWNGNQLYEQLPKRMRDFHRYVQVHYREPLDEDGEEELVIRDEEIFDAAAEPEPEMMVAEQDGLGEIAARGLGAAFEGPSTNATIGIGGAAGGAFRGRGGRRDLGTGAGGAKSFTQAPVHLRKDFDPTLCFVPEAIVGPDGKALLRIPLKDSMTTWRLRLVASNAAGATGVGTGTIRVKQPVHAAPWLAPHLTVGDVVEVPVAVRNEEAHPVEAGVTLTTSSGHLALLSAAQVLLQIPAQATGRAVFRVRAVRAGRASVSIIADTGRAQDHQERVLTVHRDARTVVAVTNGSVTGDMAFPTSMPGREPGEVRMDLYPSPLTEVISGFDGLIRAPHG